MKKLTIGRDASCDLVPLSKLVSRQHAELELLDNEWTLRDLGSANGTYVRGQRITERVLADGDVVKFADAEYLFAGGNFSIHNPVAKPGSDTRGIWRLAGSLAAAVLVLITIGVLVVQSSRPSNSELANAVDMTSPPEDTQSLIEQVKKSTVWIECGWGQGSGFAIDWALKPDSETWILTNHHVIEDCIGSDQSVTISTDDFSVRASVLYFSPSDYEDGSDFRQDLAVVSINRYVPPLSRALTIGQGHWVMAVGNPRGLSGTVTSGSVSRVLDSSNTDILPFPEDWVLSDAPINPGNSGGPLVNRLGEVVGVNTLSMTAFEGLGFANGWPNTCGELFTCQGERTWRKP